MAHPADTPTTEREHLVANVTEGKRLFDLAYTSYFRQSQRPHGNGRTAAVASAETKLNNASERLNQAEYELEVFDRDNEEPTNG